MREQLAPQGRVVNCWRISERHSLLASLLGHVDILHGDLSRGRLDDIQREVQSHDHQENHKQCRAVRAGDRPRWCFLHRVQFLANGGHSDHRRRLERWHLLRLQGEPSGHFAEIRRCADVFHQLLGQFGRPSCPHHRGIHNRWNGNCRRPFFSPPLSVAAKASNFPFHFPFPFQPTQAKWRLVFMISAAVYIVCGIFYIIFGSGQRQPWDNPDKDEDRHHEKEGLESVKTVAETQH